MSGGEKSFLPTVTATESSPDGAGQLLSSKIVHLLAATAALCVLIYLLLCALYIFQRRRARGKERKRIEDVAAILSDLTAGEYGALRRNELSEKDSAADILYTRLDSLAEHLRFTGEMQKNEKEATKSLVTDLSHQLKTPVAELSTSRKF